MTTQQEIKTKLNQLFGEDNVISEWNIAKQSQDDLTRRMYCPRVDIAVGPFNTDRRLEPNNRAISRACQNNTDLIEAIRSRSDMHNLNLESNGNPRCFMAIEIENRTGSKHRIGSIVNASAIGKIGIIATNNVADFTRIVRIRDYLEFLLSVGKSRYNPQNLMIILADNLMEALETV